MAEPESPEPPLIQCHVSCTHSSMQTVPFETVPQYTNTSVFSICLFVCGGPLVLVPG